MRHRERPRRAMGGASLLGLFAACGWAGPASAAPCASFEAAGVPFHACVDEGRGGFWLSAGGQPSASASRGEDENGRFHILSMDYEEGDRVGVWKAAADFVVTLRRDGAGPRRGDLAAEFCGPGPVPVRVRHEWPPEPRRCGQWAVLIGGSDLPAGAAERTGGR